MNATKNDLRYKNGHLPWYRRKGVPKLIVGSILVLFVVGFVGMSLFWTPYDPTAAMLSDRLVEPFSTGPSGNFYLLGTDPLGRDMTSRVMAGGQVSVLVALLTVGLCALLSTLLGVLSGYYRGWVDNALSMLCEINISIPLFLIVIMIIAIFGSSVFVLALCIALNEWVSVFRQTRSKAIVQSNFEYVTAARVMGANNWQIIIRHLIPNVVPTTIVFSTLLVGSTIIAESGLAYLGLGVSKPFPTWGRMISEGQAYMNSEWWVSGIPAICIAILVLGVNLIGDGLRAIWRME